MGIRVLVVDYDVSFRATVTALLTERGFAVAGYASDQDEAMAAFQQRRPDAVLLDVRLSGPTGFDTLRQLTALEPCPPVLLTSSDPDAITSRLATELGAVGFVPKEDLVAADLASYFRDRSSRLRG